MRTAGTLTSVSESGAIAYMWSPANLPLWVSMSGVLIGWMALARLTGRFRAGDGRFSAISAMAVGTVGVFLAVLDLATSGGGPGAGNELVGPVSAIPFGAIAVFLGRQTLIWPPRAKTDRGSC
ncbi:DUF6223 family protein [Streptomyces zhihengii]